MATKKAASKVTRPVKGTAKKISKKLTKSIQAAHRRGLVGPDKNAQITEVTVEVEGASKVPFGKHTAQIKDVSVVEGAVKVVAVATVPAPAIATVPLTPMPPAKAVKIIHERKPTPRSMITQMLLERKYTDEEIHAAVVKLFGEGKYTTKKAYVQLTRSDMNGGWIKKPAVDGRMTSFITKLERDADGNLVSIPYKPSSLRKRPIQFAL